MDRKSYWGDEIALRVFADRFKIVVCVVLQAEERLQVSEDDDNARKESMTELCRLCSLLTGERRRCCT
eukprot:746839-Hanusia_phi.AAC.9